MKKTVYVAALFLFCACKFSSNSAVKASDKDTNQSKCFSDGKSSRNNAFFQSSAKVVCPAGQECVLDAATQKPSCVRLLNSCLDDFSGYTDNNGNLIQCKEDSTCTIQSVPEPIGPSNPYGDDGYNSKSKATCIPGSRPNLTPHCKDNGIEIGTHWASCSIKNVGWVCKKTDSGAECGPPNTSNLENDKK